MSDDRSWMYRRLDPNGDIRDEFTEGVKEFLDFAFRHPTFICGDKIKCPCRKCDNMQYHVRDDVAVHLYSKGFTHYYNIWYAHGEILYKEPAGVKPSKTKNGTGICGHPQTKSRKSDGGRQKGLQKRLNMLKKSNKRRHSHASGNCPDVVVMSPVDNEVLNEVDHTHRLRSWGARKGRRSSLTTPFGTEASRTVGDTVDTGQDDLDEGPYNVARAEDSDYGSRAPIDITKGQPLEIISGSFIDPKVPRAIVSSIKSYFSQPWPTWKKVPREVKDFLWKKFEEKYTWNQDETLLVKDVWEKTCARRFRGILTQARDDAMHRANKTNVVETKGFGPAWMKPSIWNSLINIYWSDEKWQKKSKTGQKNRLSEKDGGITKHSGGSIPFAAHKKKMVLELGRPVTQLELFDRTHKRKGGKGDFIDNKSKRVRERYAEALTSKYGSDSSQLDFDPDAWLDATGGPIKGQLYGFGGREDAQTVVGTPCTSSASFSKHHGSSNSSQLLTKEEVAKLMQDKMQKMQEELSRREEEMRAQINKEVEARMHAMLSQLRIPVNRPPQHESSNNSDPSKDSDTRSDSR